MVNSICFSISVPVCHQAQFLPTALKSLRCQQANFQLAVLDATPDDSVQRVLVDYQDLLHYQYHHPDEGQSSAIMCGWEHTEGDIVAWLNADDYYFPDTLQKVAKIFAQNPTVDVVYGHSVYVTAENQFHMYFPAIQPDPSLLTRGCVICQPSCFVRRTAMERVGGLNTALHYTMDWDFWLRLYQAGCSFYFLDEMLSAVLVHPATKTLSGAARRYEEISTLLANNTSWWHHKISLAAFRYHDKLTGGAHPFSALLTRILATAGQLRQRFLRNQRAHIKGLECRTHKVVNQVCEILLPWYSNSLPNEITVTVDTPGNYSLLLENSMTPLQPCGERITQLFGQKFKGFCYKAPLTPLENMQISTKIQGEAPHWKLLEAEFN